MKFQQIEKASFCVIGKVGSTLDGEGFVQKLWADANSHFAEVAALAKTDDQGKLVGIWGAMSDLSGSFLPWENGFTVGKYLAGIECREDAEAPAGWTKWTVPGYLYYAVKCENETTFPDMIRYLSENKISLAGAVHDFTCPSTGENYMFFPVKKL